MCCACSSGVATRKLRSAIRSREEDPGKPDDKLSDRGFGTELRTDPVFLGLQKTRLLDPILSFPGTNDHPGDYRSSGCSACHVIYANDRDPAHSALYAQYGHLRLQRFGRSHNLQNERGHPIKHAFTRAIPSSQCMICHVHPGTNMVTTYFGLTWWDNEIDSDKMYPDATAQSHRRRTLPNVHCAIRKQRRHAACGVMRNFWKNRQQGIQRTVKDHAVCRFPWTRLAIPRRLQPRPKRELAG